MNYKILITNDDSIKSPLLKPLVEVLKEYASNLLVVVPLYNQSACSQTINIKEELELQEQEKIENVTTYTITGSPADCVKIAKELLNYDFDLVISGINDGYNLADDICYSGTVGAASEAEFYNKKGIAVSIERSNKKGLDHLNKAFKYVFDNNLLEETNLININIPPIVKGIKKTVQGKRRFNTTFIKTKENKYLAINKQTIDINEPFFIERTNDENADFIAIEKGYISITPMTTDKTKYHI